VTIPGVGEVFGTGGLLISWGALIDSADEKDMFPRSRSGWRIIDPLGGAYVKKYACPGTGQSIPLHSVWRIPPSARGISRGILFWQMTHSPLQ